MVQHTNIKLILVLLLSFVPKVSQSYPALHASGDYHTCSWGGAIDSQIRCWTTDWAKDMALNAPSITSLVALASGSYFTCSIHRQRMESKDLFSKPILKCWYHHTEGLMAETLQKIQEYPKDLNEDFVPVDLSASHSHVCALFSPKNGESKVRCWGRSSSLEDSSQDTLKPSEQISGIPFKNPTAIYAGTTDSKESAGYSCAVHSGNRLRCWGSYRFDEPLSEHPEVTAGEQDLVCIEKDRASASSVKDTYRNSSGLHCFTNSHRFHRIKIERKNNFWHCTIENLKTKCRSREYGAERSDWSEWEEIRDFDGARDISLGRTRICASGYFGLKCAGDMAFAKSMPRSDEMQFLGLNLRSPSDLPYFLHKLQNYIYAEDRQLVTAIEEIYRTETAFNSPDPLSSIVKNGEESQAKKFLYILRPLIESMDYDQLRTYFLPPVLFQMDLILSDQGKSGHVQLTYSRKDQKWLAEILRAALASAKVTDSQHIKTKTDLENLKKFLATSLLEEIETLQKGDHSVFGAEELAQLKNLSGQFAVDPYSNLRAGMMYRIVKILEDIAKNPQEELTFAEPLTEPISKSILDLGTEAKRTRTSIQLIDEYPNPVSETIKEENSASLSSLTAFENSLENLRSSLRPIDDMRVKLLISDSQRIRNSLERYKVEHAFVFNNYYAIHKRIEWSQSFFRAIGTNQNQKFTDEINTFYNTIYKEKGLGFALPRIILNHSGILSSLFNEFSNSLVLCAQTLSDQESAKILAFDKKIIELKKLVSGLYSEALAADGDTGNLHRKSAPVTAHIIKTFEDEKEILSDLILHRNLSLQYFDILEVTEAMKRYSTDYESPEE